MGIAWNAIVGSEGVDLVNWWMMGTANRMRMVCIDLEH
jgi:hypothetical protein